MIRCSFEYKRSQETSTFYKLRYSEYCYTIIIFFNSCGGEKGVNKEKVVQKYNRSFILLRFSLHCNTALHYLAHIILSSLQHMKTHNEKTFIFSILSTNNISLSISKPSQNVDANNPIPYLLPYSSCYTKKASHNDTYFASKRVRLFFKRSRTASRGVL